MSWHLCVCALFVVSYIHFDSLIETFSTNNDRHKLTEEGILSCKKYAIGKHFAAHSLLQISAVLFLFN